MNSAVSERLVCGPTSAVVDRACPLCSSTRHHILCEGEGKVLLKCSDCESIHVLPPPAPDELVSHFADIPDRDEDGWRKNFEANRGPVLAKISASIQARCKGGAILDVGCATGLFLERFIGNPHWRAYGVDLSPVATNMARKKGTAAVTGGLRHAQFEDASFDVITMLGAFCYLPRPQNELKEFRRLLTTAGFLVLELAWAKSRIWKLTRAPGRLFSKTRG